MFGFSKPKFNLVSGVTANTQGVSEGFSVTKMPQGYSEIQVNVSAERILDVYLGLCSLIRQPAFGLVEVPTNQVEEAKLRQSNMDPFHYDVYYFDRMQYENHCGMIKFFAQLFVNDGQITFGYGAQQGYDEIYVGRYKLFKIYADDPRKYVGFLQKSKFEYREKLHTVFDNFSEKTPGVTGSVSMDGKTIYDLIEVLKQNGFYFAERRPL
jgi:hypothetical protein